nr:unnamed protein product [Callosobruchus chinensis]
MDAIKKKMQAMKLEKDNAADKADAMEGQLKDATARCEKIQEEVQDLTKKLSQVENDLVFNKQQLENANKELDSKDKLLTQAESEVAALNRKVQLIEKIWNALRNVWPQLPPNLQKLPRQPMKAHVCAKYWKTDPSKMRNVWTN